MKMKIKMTLIFQFKTRELAKIKITSDNHARYGVKKKTSQLLVGMQTCTATLDVNMAVFQETVNLPQGTALPLLGIYQKDTKLCHMNTYSPIFLIAFLKGCRNWK